MEVIYVPELNDECGFITNTITEKEFEIYADKLGTIISRIRMEG
jgi:hypothetical protein